MAAVDLKDGWQASSVGAMHAPHTHTHTQTRSLSGRRKGDILDGRFLGKSCAANAPTLSLHLSLGKRNEQGQSVEGDKKHPHSRDKGEPNLYFVFFFDHPAPFPSFGDQNFGSSNSEKR